MKIKSPKNIWAGLMFFVFGAAFVLVAQSYQMGTAVRMGPSYFPTMLGGMLAVLGLIIFCQAFVVKGEQLSKFYMKPNIFVLGSVVLFALLLKPFGLVISIIVLIFVSALGGFDFRLKEVIILSIVLVIFALLVFVKGLGLPFQLCPGAMDESCNRWMSGRA